MSPSVMPNSEILLEYYCFPVFGLTCEDASSPEEFIFSDATLLRGGQVRGLLRERAGEDMSVLLPDEAQYLVVRMNEQVTDANGNAILESARKRAREIIAGISIPLLAYSDFRSVPSLGTEMFNSGSSHVVHFNNRVLNIRNETYQGIPIRTSSIRYTREALLEVLKRPPFTWLTEAVLFEESPDALTADIRTAASVYYVSINQPTAISQFFGCYASMEVLLKTGKHGEILTRAKVLVGDDIHAYYVEIPGSEVSRSGKKKTLDLIRNAIAHDGADCTEDAVVCCSRMVLNVLCAVSYYRQSFGSVQELCRMLDHIYWLRTNKVNDPFGILRQWEQLRTADYQWHWQPARVVYFFDLHVNTESGNTPLRTASALYVLRSITKWSESDAFKALDRAMYMGSIAFTTSEEAWTYIRDHSALVEQQASLFFWKP